MSLPSSPRTSNPPNLSTTRPTPVTRSSGRGLGAQPVAASSFNTSAFTPQIRSSLSSPPRTSLSTSSPLVPQQSQAPARQSMQQGPNYNISLPPAPVAPSIPMAPMAPSFPPSQPMSAAPVSFAPAMGGVLAPSRPAQPAWPTNGGTKQLSKSDWGDFDPLA